MIYEQAEWVPWKRYDDRGQITYWQGVNKPVAVVLHIMAGYASTARQWAGDGHYGASWHFTVSRKGNVMQHLELDDAGYQAGIPDSAPDPTWPLWRGHGENVNWYTIGIEHEGFPGEPFSPEQAAASKALCKWLAETLAIPFDRDHFPPHADIDVVNRVNDFNIPALREAHYAYLFEEEDEMTPEEKARMDRLENLVGAWGYRDKAGTVLTGQKALQAMADDGVSLVLTAQNQNKAILDLASAATQAAITGDSDELEEVVNNLLEALNKSKEELS